MYKILFFIALLLFAISCNNEPKRFTVDVSLNKKEADSAYIFIYEKEYGTIRLYDSGVVKNGTISFTGEIPAPKIAFLKFDKDTVPYYFILNNSPVSISFNDDKFILKGDADNTQYFRYLLRKQNIENAKKSLWNKYEKCAGDSILTDSIENVLKTYNDRLTDSLKNITDYYIKTESLAGEIVWRQSGNRLTAKKLN